MVLFFLALQTVEHFDRCKRNEEFAEITWSLLNTTLF